MIVILSAAKNLDYSTTHNPLNICSIQKEAIE